MQWELLTSKELEEMAKKEKICLIPIGILERHGDHGPLGTDVLAAHKIAVEAAKIEPCVVFPGYWFGQGHEATHSPGAISTFSVTVFPVNSGSSSFSPKSNSLPLRHIVRLRIPVFPLKA